MRNKPTARGLVMNDDLLELLKNQLEIRLALLAILLTLQLSLCIGFMLLLYRELHKKED